MGPVMVGTYINNGQDNDYLSSHYPQDAFFHATCQKSGNLHSNISVKPIIVCHQTFHGGKWPLSKTLSHAFCDTDDPITIYGRFWIL